MNILLFNYCQDLILGSAETCFLEVGAYVSLKQATRVSERVVFAEFE